ncbi:MAG: hypothetical protein II198_01150 [Bacteroidaceae bacterium]|nr:hypothetical protein [Bacteroidaceae bacterium]
MGVIEKVVLIKNAVETLGYFSKQLAIEFTVSGLEVYFVDYNNLVDTVEGLYRFLTYPQRLKRSGTSIG